jgi:disulfide bond formation protein DsbB
MAAALFFQFHEKLNPCPLCISQRIAVILVGLIFLLAFVHNPGKRGMRRYAFAVILTALMGASISGRHVWIQHLPKDEVPACGPGLSYMFQYFPLTDTIKMMLSGTGDCAQVDWVWLGLSMPAWVLTAFVGLALLGGLILKRAAH